MGRGYGSAGPTKGEIAGEIKRLRGVVVEGDSWLGPPVVK